ncbi:MAG: hypothetical protein WAN46_15610 [Gammaproteobacteria bacterium]
MSYITLIKKVKFDGTLCSKCADVWRRLEQDGLLQAIDRIVIADERDPASEGMVLARRHAVNRAPFFIVEEAGQRARVYTVYLAFLKEVLRKRIDARDELAELIEHHPDLDFI